MKYRACLTLSPVGDELLPPSATSPRTKRFLERFKEAAAEEYCEDAATAGDAGLIWVSLDFAVRSRDVRVLLEEAAALILAALCSARDKQKRR